MARVHFVKAARKEIPNAGIKKGDSYYWWAFRYGGKHVSKTPPRPSQLTQSEYLSTYLGCEETVSDALETFTNGGSVSDLESYLEEAKDQLEELKSDCEDKLSNLQDAFSGGSPTIDLLEQRVESCDETISGLEDAISTCNEHESDDDEEYNEGDEVTYRDEEYTVSKVGLKDDQGNDLIEITSSDESTVVRLCPSMSTDLKKNEDWRQEVEDEVGNINWNAE